MYRYDIYPGHHPESGSTQGQKSPVDGYPFHASALRDTDPVSGRGSSSSHIDHNILHALRSGSFLTKSLAKLTVGDTPVTFYTNNMLTQK
jgi:hypothetical protein